MEKHALHGTPLDQITAASPGFGRHRAPNPEADATLYAELAAMRRRWALTDTPRRFRVRRRAWSAWTYAEALPWVVSDHERPHWIGQASSHGAALYTIDERVKFEECASEATA